MNTRVTTYQISPDIEVRMIRYYERLITDITEILNDAIDSTQNDAYKERLQKEREWWIQK